MPEVKLHDATSRQDDGVPCVTADALALYQRLRFAGTSSWPSWISHFTGSFVGHSPSEMLCPPAVTEKGTFRVEPRESRGDTRTHTHTCVLQDSNRKGLSIGSLQDLKLKLFAWWCIDNGSFNRSWSFLWVALWKEDALALFFRTPLPPAPRASCAMRAGSKSSFLHSDSLSWKWKRPCS